MTRRLILLAALLTLAGATPAAALAAAAGAPATGAQDCARALLSAAPDRAGANTAKEPLHAPRYCREKLLVFATPWRVIALGESGVAWQTSRIAIDGIAVGEPVGGELAGVADPDDYEAQGFVVELRTGHHRGGFPFPG